MSLFNEVDWGELFTLSLPLLEIVVRGTAMFWFLFLLMRFVLRRNTATVGMADMLMVVLLADAAQNGMSGEAMSIADGMLLVSVLMIWNYCFDWLAFNVPAIARFADPPPLLLVDRGRLMRRNMRAEHITEDELRAQLREQGVESLSAVKAMYLEPSGEFSILKA